MRVYNGSNSEFSFINTKDETGADIPHIICAACQEKLACPTGKETNYMLKCELCNADHKTDPKVLKKVIKDNNACCLIF